VLATRTTRTGEAPLELVERNAASAGDVQHVHTRRLEPRQTEGVYSALRVAAATALVLILGGACGGDDDRDDTTAPVTDPGPNPTGEDPGPNDTSGGPQTVQGVTHLDAATECITLETDAGVLVLVFQDYELGDDGEPAIVAVEDGRTLARDGDQLVVSGQAGALDPDCGGTVFAVESLNSVTPAA
jgi:hypothetical protein